MEINLHNLENAPGSYEAYLKARRAAGAAEAADVSEEFWTSNGLPQRIFFINAIYDNIKHLAETAKIEPEWGTWG